MRRSTAAPGDGPGPPAAAWRGMLWATLATFLFSVMFASGKATGGAVPALQIMLIRYLSGTIVVLATSLVRGPGLAVLRSRNRGLHLLRSLCGAGGGAAGLYAPMHLPIADATAIALTSGMLTMVLAVLLLGERVGPRHALAALACLAGALIVVRGGGGSGASLEALPPFPTAIAFFGALCIGIELVLLKLLAVRDTALTTLLYVNGLGTLVLIPPALLVWQPAPWPLLLALALLGPLAILGQWCNIQAFRLADAALLAPVGYSWIVFATLIGVLLFGEVPGLATLSGSLLIVAGGIALARLRHPPARPGDG